MSRPLSPRGMLVVVTVVAGALAAALAVALFVLVRDARLRDSLERARVEAEFDLTLAETLLADDTDLQQAVESYERERGVDAILISGGRTFRSDGAAGISVPRDLRAIAGTGRLGYERVSPAGAPILIVGGPTPDRRHELYLLFSETAIDEDLEQLRIALVVGCLAIVLIAFAFARSAANRIATLAEAEAWGRRFTSDVSHELRTPVAALVSEASFLEQHLGEMPPEARRAAELLIGDAGRLRRLVEDLTDLAALDAGREEVRTERFDLGALLDGSVRSRGWGDRVSIRSEPVEVESDRTRVDRIAANLIANALEHGGGGVEARTRRDDGQAVLEVSDRGPGIEAPHLPRIFDRFYRADPARSGPGSGLGLSIARENARLLGGDVEAWSEPGRGARFTLRLPAVAEPLRPGGSRVAGGPDDGPRSRHEGGAP